ncbi:MAG: hypothetical protein H6907_14705 [Hyphomicrobiales bacterium]|nr:hypothetical protein [Hyphomicrobiales bacterium]MCP5372974.1 hypothetical protein [Hyphomicrobiales bacterium]
MNRGPEMTYGVTQTIAKAFVTALMLVALILAVGPALAVDGAARMADGWAGAATDTASPAATAPRPD